MCSLYREQSLCVCTAPNVIGYGLAFHIELTGPIVVFALSVSHNPDMRKTREAFVLL